MRTVSGKYVTWVASDSLMAQQVKNPPAMQKTQQIQFQSLSREDPLEKEMTTHASILAWKSHGQRSLVGYSPWGRKRIGHDLVTKQQQKQNGTLQGGLHCLPYREVR